MKKANAFIEHAWSMLLRGGLDEEAFRGIAPGIMSSNMRNVLFLSVLCAGVLFLLLLISLGIPGMNLRGEGYLAALLSCIAVAFLSRKATAGRPRAALMILYVFIGMLFSLGIYLGPVSDPDHLSVTFIVMLFAVPQVFSDRPLRMISVLLFFSLLFVLAAAKAQAEPYFGWNVLNVIIFGFMSACIGSHLMGVKFRELAAARKIRKLSTTDSLTGMGNRISFERVMEALGRKRRPGFICVFDLNGLKRVNDGLGHAAGDDLLVRAAACITRAVKPYGRCYRIGGDEFVAILGKNSPDESSIRHALNAEACAASPQGAAPVSIAMGGAPFDEHTDTYAALKEADRAMYEDKALYYRSTGVDRRRKA